MSPPASVGVGAGDDSHRERDQSCLELAIVLSENLMFFTLSMSELDNDSCTLVVARDEFDHIFKYFVNLCFI